MLVTVSRIFSSKFWASSLALPLLCASLFAQEVVLESLEVQDFLGKKVYTNVRVMGVTEKGLKVSHDAGLAVIPFKALPPDIAARYSPADAAPAEGTAPMSTAATPTSSAAAVTDIFDPSCLVFISTESQLGQTSYGTGFIMEDKGKAYVYTNAHVLCGSTPSFTKKITRIETGAGKVIATPYELELSDHTGELQDIARFPIALKEGEAAYRMAELNPSQYVNNNVVAYGNSLGASVMTTLGGKVIALGTEQFEVSCEIVPGNSGGPIVLADTKQVIGISTYLIPPAKELSVEGTSLEGIRRFALRPEKVTKWRRMQTTSLITALEEMNNFHMDSYTLLAGLATRPKSGYRGLDVEDITISWFNTRKVITEGRTRSLGAAMNNGIIKVNQRLGASATGVAGNYASGAYAEFFSAVAATSSSQLNSMQTANRAPYLKSFFGEIIDLRKLIHGLFVAHGQQFRF